MSTQRQNQLLNSKVLTKSAAARILGYKWGVALDPKDIEVRHYDKVVWVHVKGHSPQFVSKKKFVEHFQEMRLAQSQSPSLRVNLSGSLVENITKGTKYHICGGEYDCECYDYTSQDKDSIGPICFRGEDLVVASPWSSPRKHMGPIESLREVISQRISLVGIFSHVLL